MGSFSAFNIAVLVVIISAHNMIIPVNGQCTVPGCESENSSISIVTGMRQMSAEFYERLQAIDRRSQEQDICMNQVLSIQQLLNASIQHMNNKHDTAMTAIDRRSQEQLQGMMKLNTSFQQMKNQQDTIRASLQTVDRHLDELNITIKNETQKSWKLAIAVGLDLTRSPVPPIIDNWIVIMQRINGSLNFNQSWIEYKNGFGDFEKGEFWLGNEKIHRLTNRFFYTLRIEVQLNRTGVWYHADYATFSLDSENNKYTLRLSGYNGSAGDSITTDKWGSHCNLGGMSFSTWDADHDRVSYNCASFHGVGWWVNGCGLAACLTCQYRDGYFRWYSLNHVASGVSLRAARMMIRSN